jgi:hypothetical protein
MAKARSAVPTRGLASFSEPADRFPNVTAPIRRQEPLRDKAMEAAVWPIARFDHVTVLHGIKMNVIDVALQVSVVANRVLPIAALPNSLLASRYFAVGSIFTCGEPT